MAVLTKALTELRANFNTRFPARLKTSDGWIGDTAHQANKSGHNPDDTSGSKPEYTDPDSKAEVRAIDVDKDLRDSGGITMQQCCDAIRANERDRKRLAYMIYNRRIASQSSGWAWQSYSGSNPHTEHAHFSGDPDYDEDDAEFTSITNLGQEDEMTQEEFNALMDGWVNRTLAASDSAASNIVAVRNKVRAVVWQYVGGGIPEGKSALGTLAGAHDYSKVTAEGLDQVSPETIAAIEAAAYSGAESGAAAGVDPAAIASAVLAGLQAAGLDPTLYAQAVEDAVREVFADAGTAE